MTDKTCYFCGKANLSKVEIGLYRKLVDKSPKFYLCLECLAEDMEADTEFLLVKAEEFKIQGCRMF